MNVVNFLSHHQTLGKCYTTINSYRSALSSVLPYIDGVPVGKNNLVIRLMRGIFNENPPRPRYTNTWQVSLVLDYLCSLDDNQKLELLPLSEKLASLVALVTAQRVQTLKYLDISCMTISDNSAVFQILDLLKNTTIRDVSKQTVELPAFPSNQKLCVLSTLKEYLSRTKPFRELNGETRLFLSSKKPHNRVTSSTIARWLKNTLSKSGIDISIFSAHSYRSASSSSAFNKGVPIQEIMSKANWSNAKTFRDFYYKPSEVQESTFASSILDQSTR